MKSSHSGLTWTFVRATMFWIVAAAIVLFVVGNLGPTPPSSERALLPRWVPIAVSGLTWALMFSTFAGGLALSARQSSRPILTLLLLSAGFGVATYVLDSYVSEYARYYSIRPDVQQRVRPLGPNTPGVQAQYIAYVLEHGHTTTTLTTSQPFGIPARWRIFRVQAGRVAAVLPLISGVLGYLLGLLTVGLSPPVRRRTRWMFGLMNAFLWVGWMSYLTTHMRLGLLTRDPYLHAWASLVPHLAIILILIPVVRDKLRD